MTSHCTLIACGCQVTLVSGGVDLHHCRLHAAAPALLVALSRVVERLQERREGVLREALDDWACLRAAQAAITQATEELP